MLMPTSANVERIIRDFSGGQQQYAGAHLFFIDGPSPSVFLSLYTPLTSVNVNPRSLRSRDPKTGLAEELFQRLTSSSAEPFLRGLQDLYVNFWGASPD
jgi:syntaxin-binding protein 1